MIILFSSKSILFITNNLFTVGQFKLIIAIFNICFTKDKLSSDVISTKKIAQRQSKNKLFKNGILDNNFSSNKISLIFNPNVFSPSNDFKVFNDSKPIKLNIIYLIFLLFFDVSTSSKK